MTLVEAILTVLLRWPAFGAEPEPETDLARQVRLTQVAIVMTEAAVARPGGWPAVRVAASLLTLGRCESRFARYVGLGLCHTGPKGARCGLGRGRRHLSRSYWQLERVACPELWKQEPGSFAAQRVAARCASRLYIGAYYRCKTGHAGAFAGYALGSGCAWPRAERRARVMARVESRLRQLMSSPAQPVRTSPRAESSSRCRSGCSAHQRRSVEWLTPSRCAAWTAFPRTAQNVSLISATACARRRVERSIAPKACAIG